MTSNASITIKAMRIFNWNKDNGVYVVTVSNMVLFRLSVKFITIRMSFKQTATCSGRQDGDKMCKTRRRK